MKKLAVVEATEAAASAITTREHERRVSDQFDRIMQMKANSEMYQNKANELKRQFFEERNNGESEEMLRETRQKRNHAKNTCKHYNKQYKEINKDIEYDSLESSEDSLASL